MTLKEADIKDLQLNPFTKIGKEWALLTAGDGEKCNTMTVSWGGVGVMWGKDVVTVYVRPQRYTKEFIDTEDRFTLSFYAPEHKRALGVLGSKSGRDSDKVAEVGFHPVRVDGSWAFAEADLVFVCRKLYADDIKPERFTDAACDTDWYPEHDYHTMYIAEIEKVLAKE